MSAIRGSSFVASLLVAVSLVAGEASARVQGPAQTSAPALAESGGVGPRVHIVPSRPAAVQLFELTLERTPGGQYSPYRGAYRSLCTAPCGEVVAARPGRLLFFGGAGITPSRLLELPETPGDLSVRVRPGRRAVRSVGIALISVGAIGVVAGGLLRRVESSITHGEIRHGDSTAILVTSASLLVGGVVMYVLGRTGFKFSPRGLGRQRARARF